MSTDYLQLNQTIRKVGEHMHPQWWDKLGLMPWQTLYKTNPLVANRLDNVILSRTGCFDGIPKGDIGKVQPWVRLLPRLLMLSTAAGLVAQNCPDYLWDSEYREALKQTFSQAQIEQLIALWPPGVEPPVWSPNVMTERAQKYAVSAISQYWNGSPFWSVLRLNLPVVEPLEEMKEDEVACVVAWIFKLERFL
ncbi:type III secretion system domain-containing protein [Vibrio ostreicida]|uniref:Type III secretion system domain-containing protein n=1 Tax=Vibrio ostreicida TaxID=526588 RepID=A0ABT8BSP9_9VIBR|nr:type III secretion system domain-containing protein [Vibrio ostreicida]MDN3610021.1 type III secretion system domain-containing protein [Vibrio ostreicida]MDN3611189.1 type III secretion system domain-containing protein [Vibrio ostreicida]NPD10446.1 hypothetical protein [Vibrio ostreicida]